MYLLETNVASELRRVKPHGAVLAWVNSVSSDDLYLPAVVAAEIQMGIGKVSDNDPGKAGELSAWLSRLMASSQWITPSPEIFRIWGTLRNVA